MDINFGKRLIKSPKLYFIDSGLACRLLGIQTKEQLFLNPMRGSLFEGFIISELIKNRLNKGLSPDLWFYRDNIGIEIDCLIEHGGTLKALEIKSGKTFTEDMISGLMFWQKTSNIPVKNENCVLLYSGSQKTTINGINIVPWYDIQKM